MLKSDSATLKLKRNDDYLFRTSRTPVTQQPGKTSTETGDARTATITLPEPASRHGQRSETSFVCTELYLNTLLAIRRQHVTHGDTSLNIKYNTSLHLLYESLYGEYCCRLYEISILLLDIYSFKGLHDSKVLWHKVR